MTETDCRSPLPDNDARWDDMRMRFAGDAMVDVGLRHAKECRSEGLRVEGDSRGQGYEA